MSILANILERLGAGDTTFETFDRYGDLVHRISAGELVERVRAQRPRFAVFKGADRRIALLFRPEETVAFLIASFAAIAEGLTVVPFYPSWTEATQQLYLKRYKLRAVAVGEGFRARVEAWRGFVDQVITVGVFPGRRDALPASGGHARPGVSAGGNGASPPVDDVFPRHLPENHPCALIFTSGTSGDLCKCTLITQANLRAAVENIASLDFLRPGMVLHCPLSASHIFAFVVILGFLALAPRRVIFSDVQYLARLPEERIGKIDAMILVPMVLNRMRAAFYERILRPELSLGKEGEKPDPLVARLARIPRRVRQGLKRLVQASEKTVIAREAGLARGRAGWPLVLLARRLFGSTVRRRLASPEFVVVGGAKPTLRAMAFLEAMGIRCLQGWGMTETTGPMAVCRLGDRYRGAFGTCGDLFRGVRAHIEGEELVVEGPQVAAGYLEPDSTLVPFKGRKRTGDCAEFDASGRLKILGKASDRITLQNGINYNPLPYEERIHTLDLHREHLLEEAVVVGDGQARLGSVFFLREPHQATDEVLRYLAGLLREVNASLRADDQIGPWAVSRTRLRDADVLSPAAKLIRRHVEERYAFLYEEERAFAAQEA